MDGFLYGSGLALSGAFAPAPPKGEPLAKPETLPYCQGLSLWERWHRVAMTERASPLPVFILLHHDMRFAGAVGAQQLGQINAGVQVALRAFPDEVALTAKGHHVRFAER